MPHGLEHRQEQLQRRRVIALRDPRNPIRIAHASEDQRGRQPVGQGEIKSLGARGREPVAVGFEGPVAVDVARTREATPIITGFLKPAGQHDADVPVLMSVPGEAGTCAPSFPAEGGRCESRHAIPGTPEAALIHLECDAA
jgi:hypothetical protein